MKLKNDNLKSIATGTFEETYIEDGFYCINL